MRHDWHNLLPLVPFLVGQFGFDFGSIGDFLLGLLSDLINFLLQVLQFIWQALIAVANFIFSVLQFIYKFLTTLFADISRAFKWIWNTVIKGALTKLLTAYVKVRAWLEKTFRPLIDFLKKVRAWYDKFYRMYVRPVLNLIQHIRQVLTVFRLLGFKWAKKLDSLLSKIQGDIIKVFTTLRGYINQIISTIDLIVDPTFILRRNPLFAALVRSVPELRNLLLASVARPLTQGEIDRQQRDKTWYAPSAAADNLAYFKHGQLPPDLEQARQEFIDAKVP